MLLNDRFAGFSVDDEVLVRFAFEVTPDDVNNTSLVGFGPNNLSVYSPAPRVSRASPW